MFTVDVEEYFQVSVFDKVVERAQWDSLPSRVERSVHTLLDLLARYETYGTFFTLGWIADRHPHLVKAIAGAGHEIASHGWSHRRVPSMGRKKLRDELRDSKAILEEVSGQEVSGFRAPSFSIVPGTEWAFDVLLEEGYRYDSSLFPIRRLGYGYPGAAPVPHTIARDDGTLIELPMATTVVAGLRVPAAGGAYLRLLPFGLTRRALEEHRRNGQSTVFYIHPWEVDPEQPRLAVSPFARLRHYGGLGRTMPRLERLLSEFQFTSINRQLDLDRPVAGSLAETVSH
jgi:polysaccharide deacetylase family protein (PEP-CTERM system associated)